jgi:hypothetical protein
VSLTPDTESFPARCHLSAERCRRRADAAMDEVSKFAEEWLELADEADLSTCARRASGAG